MISDWVKIILQKNLYAIYIHILTGNRVVAIGNVETTIQGSKKKEEKKQSERKKILKIKFDLRSFASKNTALSKP